MEEWIGAFRENEDLDVSYLLELKGQPTNEDCFRALKENLADLGYYKFQGEEAASDFLQFNLGYDGITHIGGGRFNKKDNTRHRVYIAFNDDQIQIVSGRSLATGQNLKNTPPEAEEAVQPERPHHPKGTDFDALVEHLQNNLEDLNNMEPVAVLDGTEIPKEGRATERVFSFLNRIGMSVLRPGFGDVLFSKNKIKSSFIGHGVSDAKIELMAGVPEVISKGDQIGFEPNWKGRGYDSYVFAGPVMYKGSPRIIGVIVNEYKGRGNKYYLHEVVDQNGDLIYGEKKEPEATSDGRTQGSGTVVTSDSETSIPQQDQNSNGNFAETTESSFQSEEEELADLQERMEILMEEAETDGFNQEFFNEQLARMLEEERAIREKWSVGAAPGGFDPLSDWQLGTDQFHPINDRAVEAEAENWGRAPVDIPVRDPFGQLTSKTASTLINAGMTPDQISRGLAEMARNGQLSRIPYTDSA